MYAVGHAVLTPNGQRLAPEDVEKVDGIPVTTVARTALDMAEVLSPHWLAKLLERMELERVFHLVCRRIGLPEPEEQVPIGPYTVDSFWPAAGLVVETDGREYHTTRAAFERNRRRDVDLAAQGLRVLRVDWWQVTEPSRALVTTLSRLRTFGTI